MPGALTARIGRALAAAAALGLLALPAHAARDDLDLVSRATGAAAANGTSTSAAVSADGRHVVFASDAENLVSGDVATTDVFVRDMVAGTTELMSRAPGPGPAADAVSADPVISGDGMLVAFASRAENLSPDDGPGTSDIFIRSRQLTITLVVSNTVLNGPAADGDSQDPALAADALVLAFTSDADNLSTEDDNAVRNVFARDLRDDRLLLVSRATGPGGAGANGASRPGDISADGRWVTFDSTADNLSGLDDDSLINVFVRDIVNDTTSYVGPAGSAAASGSAISADGRWVAFLSDVNGLSADDADGTADVFLRDMQTGVTTLVSRASGSAGAGANAVSVSVSMSRDGRRVAFTSLATNLSADDGDPYFDVFVRDVAEGTTTLVSRAAGPAGAGALGQSSRPALSADGRHVVFESGADNLSALDENAFINVFRRDVVGDPPAAVSPPAVAPPLARRPASGRRGRHRALRGGARHDRRHCRTRPHQGHRQARRDRRPRGGRLRPGARRRRPDLPGCRRRFGRRGRRGRPDPRRRGPRPAHRRARRRPPDGWRGPRSHPGRARLRCLPCGVAAGLLRGVRPAPVT